MSDSQPPLRTLHHQLASLESQFLQLKAAHASQTSGNTAQPPWRRRGRALRRLVSLGDNVMDMLVEAQRRRETELSAEPSNEEEDRLYASHEALKKWVPELQKWIDTTEDLTSLDSVLKHLTAGGDAARSDDACRLKTHVAMWLNESHPSDHPLNLIDKFGRGFRSDVTGMLLCPAEYNWNSPEHRTKIRDLHPDFVVTASSWPTFLYEDYKYNATDPAKGLFKGSILVKSFKAVFTSPSSADDEDDAPTKRRHGERRTRRSVAQILNMKKVNPRAIAYIAVQVRFALSNCGAWRARDVLFDYPTFYNAIVEWFEETDGAEEEAFIDELLLWWNRAIFGREAVLDYRPQNTAKGSVAASFKRRRIENVMAEAGAGEVRIENVAAEAGPSNVPA